MKKTALSEIVASEMNARLTSNENKSLFRGAFTSEQPEVNAVDDNAAKDEKDCGMADESSADDVDVDSNDADDADDTDDADTNDADDVSNAFDTAVSSLLNASAALDVVGFEKAATMSVNLASLVAEAAKKMKDAKKSKKDSKKSDKKNSKKDSKKPDSKSSKDAKKSDKKDSKKDSKKEDPKSSKKSK